MAPGETASAASDLKRHKKAFMDLRGGSSSIESTRLTATSHLLNSAKCMNFIKFTWVTGFRLCRDTTFVAQCHIRTNGILMDKLPVNLIVQQLHGCRRAARPCRQSETNPPRMPRGSITWRKNPPGHNSTSPLWPVSEATLSLNLYNFHRQLKSSSFHCRLRF